MCVLCKKDVENVHHLFLGCEFTWQVWCAWLVHFGRKWSFPGTVKEHFQCWTGATSKKEESTKWFICFLRLSGTFGWKETGGYFRIKPQV